CTVVLLPRRRAGHRALPRVIFHSPSPPPEPLSQVQPPTGPSAMAGDRQPQPDRPTPTRPHRSVHELSQRYGPLMSLRLGSFPAVVGSSVEMARFFLRTHDLAFLDRPRMAAGKYIGYDYSNLLWSPYGAYWLQARKLCKTAVLSAARLRQHEHARQAEVWAMLRRLHAGPAAGRVLLLRDHLFMLNIDVSCLMLLGKKYVGGGGDSRSPTTAEELKWMIEEFFYLSGADNVGDMIPWLNWLDPQGYVGRLKRLRKMFDRFPDHVLNDHEERRRREGEQFVAMDWVDLLLTLADDPNLEVPIDRDGVRALMVNLLIGLPDTASATVEWAMSELLRSPDALTKATQELDRVVGDRHVTEGNISDLPYLEAVVKETMRLHPATPMLAPRLSREDVSAGGYDIPALDAGEFRPERFVGSSVDVQGRDMELLPFGSGRRMCPGVSLGLKMVQVILANLLHAYAWRLPDGVTKETLSMEDENSLSVVRKVPLEAVAEPRLPEHLYAGP
ncbi:hypothetical protein U9M48_012206, partial [Paspalum notatum var. saurae]